MKILIVDKNSEGQASLAKIVESFDSNEQDTLDLSVSLAGEGEYLERAPHCDVLLLGPGCADDAALMARRARAASGTIQILLIVSDDTYSTGIFRAAHVAGVRKVLSESGSSLDLLQELVSIHEEFRRAGRAKSGTLVVITHAKGGVGASTMCAALAEACNEAGRWTLLWDFDLETRDLCRSLTVPVEKNCPMDGWLDGTAELTRQAFKEALVAVADNTSMLRPPAVLQSRYRLSGTMQGCAVMQRLIDLARCSHDNVIVDLAGHMNPAAEVLLRAADTVVMVVDDSVLGLSAAHEHIAEILAVLKGDETLRVVCSGTTLKLSEISAQLGAGRGLSKDVFSLPVFPVDSAAGRWPGTGKTLYRLGRKETQQAVEDLARALKLILGERTSLKPVTHDGSIAVPRGRSAAAEQDRASLRMFLQKVSGLSFS